MKRKEIVKNISKKIDVKDYLIEKIIIEFMEEIKMSLKNHNNVYLRGFGTFLIKKRLEKKARNVAKNEEIILPEKNIPYFKISKEFKNQIK